MMISRVATVATLALGITFAGVGATSAQAAPVVPVGPECRPGVVAAVLNALVGAGVPLTPGQKIQYLQVSQRPDGSYFVEPCVVTVPVIGTALA